MKDFLYYARICCIGEILRNIKKVECIIYSSFFLFRKLLYGRLLRRSLLRERVEKGFLYTRIRYIIKYWNIIWKERRMYYFSWKFLWERNLLYERVGNLNFLYYNKIFISGFFSFLNILCEQFIIRRDGKFEAFYFYNNFVIINIVLNFFIKNTKEIFLNINEMRNFFIPDIFIWKLSPYKRMNFQEFI